MFCPKWVLWAEISALRKIMAKYLSFQVGDFFITPSQREPKMLVSEVVGNALWRQYPKPKPLPIPKQNKPKPRPKLQKRPKPRPFNEPKPDELS